MSGRKRLDFKGKRFYYNNLVELNKKLGFKSVLKTKQLVNDVATGNIKRFLKKGEDIVKVDLTKKPLLSQPFGVKRISNRAFYDLKKCPKLRGWEILTGSQAYNETIAVTIQIKVEIRFSDEFVVPNNGGIVIWEVEIAPSDILDFIQTEMISFVAETYMVEPDKVRIVGQPVLISTYTKQPLDITNMKLGKLKQKLTHLYNEVHYENTGKEGQCIQEWLKLKHPKIWDLDLEGRNKKSNQKKLDYYNSLSTTNDIKEYCVKNKVRMTAYDIVGNLIAYNYPEKAKKRSGVRNCAINFIAYDNHFYPIKNAKLDKCVPKLTGATNIPNLDEKLSELINAGELPKVSVDNSLEISAISTKNERFVNNPDFDICSKLLQDFGLGDQMTDFVNLKNIFKPISQLYLKNKLNSFLPQNDRWIKSAYNYTRKNCDVNRMRELEKINLLKTLDKKKCYSYALSSLKFCITTAIYSNIYKKYKGEKIIPSYLYVVKPELSTILLDSYNIYSGEHLIYCNKKGVNFEIIEYLQGDENPNYYKQMIIDLYNKLVKSGKYTDGEKAFKNIVNIMIGKMERGRDEYSNIKVTKICGADERKHTKGYAFKVENTDYFCCYEIEKKYDFDTKKPIAIQVKDKSRRIIYEMFEKLGLREEEIIQVKTDSFTFIDSRGINFEKYLNENLDGWKLEDYSPITATVKRLEPITFQYANNIPNYNRLFDCYAGCGKSYFIKEEIKNRQLEDYLIISPSWNALKEFLEEGFNATTVQKWSNFDRIPDEKYIYIDEMGLMDADGWKMVYKMYKMGKVISGFGDFKQLLPAIDKRRFNQPNFIDKIFTHKLQMNNNYRNTFTKNYYDKLLDTKQSKNWKRQQVFTNNVDWKVAEKIIAYTNKNVDYYNKKKMDYLGLQLWDIGLKIICVENVKKLASKDIYNRYEFTILEKEEDDDEVKYKIYEDKWVTETDLEKYFKPAYCITLYGAQGKSIKGIHFVLEDIGWIDGTRHDYFSLNQDYNSELYTLISRIKMDNVDSSNFEPYENYTQTFSCNFEKRRNIAIKEGKNFIVGLEE